MLLFVPMLFPDGSADAYGYTLNGILSFFFFLCFLQSKQKTTGYPLLEVAGEKILNATRLTSGDLNDYKQPCILMVGSLPVANKPENFVYVIVLSSDSSEDCVQIAFSISKQLLYVRSFNSKSWSEWKSIGNIGA